MGVTVPMIFAFRWFRSDHARRVGYVTGASLGFGLVVGYLGFNNVLYKAVLPSRSQKGEDFLGETYNIFVDKIGRLVGGAKSHVEPFVYTGTGSGFLNGLRLLQYLLLSAFFAYAVWGAFRRRDALAWADARRYIPAVIVAIVAVTFVVDLGSYSLQGVVSLKYMLFAFPLLGAAATFAAHPPRVRAIVAVFFAVMAILAVAKFVSSAESGSENLLLSNDYRSTEPGAAWFFDKTLGSPRVLADLHTQGKLLVLGAERDRTILNQYYDASTYSSLLFPDIKSSPWDYAFISAANAHEPMISVYWRSYEPFGSRLGQIEANPSLDRMYDDGSSVIITHSGI